MYLGKLSAAASGTILADLASEIFPEASKRRVGRSVNFRGLSLDQPISVTFGISALLWRHVGSCYSHYFQNKDGNMLG